MRMVRKPGYNYAGARLSSIQSFTKVKRKYTTKMLKNVDGTVRSMTKRDRTKGAI